MLSIYEKINKNIIHCHFWFCQSHVTPGQWKVSRAANEVPVFYSSQCRTCYALGARVKTTLLNIENLGNKNGLQEINTEN